MSKDPIVDEVRAARAAIAAEHGNDLKRIIAAFRRKEGADGRRVVDLTAKRPSKGHPKRKAGVDRFWTSARGRELGEHRFTFLGTEGRLLETHGGAPKPGRRDVADRDPRIAAQLLDGSDAQLVIDDEAPGFLQDFGEDHLVSDEWEVPAQSGLQQMQHLLNAIGERLAAPIDKIRVRRRSRSLHRKAAAVYVRIERFGRSVRFRVETSVLLNEGGAYPCWRHVEAVASQRAQFQRYSAYAFARFSLSASKKDRIARAPLVAPAHETEHHPCR